MSWTSFFVLILLVSYAFVLMRPIDLTVQDLGRHLMNGKEVLAGNWQVLYQNYYSYTAADYRFVNHHWLFGLINHLVYSITGFKGVHLLHILVLLVGAGLLFDLFKKYSSAFISLLVGLTAVLFLSTRLEIRPEALGWVFFIHTLWQLKRACSENQLTQKQIVLLLLQQVVWVNWHISFIFGISLPFLLWLCSSVFKSPKLDRRVVSRLFKTCFGLLVVSLLNPNFISGLLQPLTIFIDYGYTIVENQSLFFLWQAIRIPNFFSLLIFSIVSALLLLYQWRQISLYELMVLFTGFILGFSALRHTPIFVGLSLPIFSRLIHLSWNKLQQQFQIEIEDVSKPLFLSLLYGPFLLLLFSGKMIVHARINNRAIGLPDSQLQAVNYIKTLQLVSPIFNNYDLGSYLIFHFYPEFKVFVDNRPEAYGKKFFQDKYIPMQLNPSVWQDQMDKYRFNTIIYGRSDSTYWGQAFLAFIEGEPDWQQDYIDDKVVVYRYLSQ